MREKEHENPYSPKGRKNKIGVTGNRVKSMYESAREKLETYIVEIREITTTIAGSQA